MRRESLAHVSPAGPRNAWEAACARASGSVQIRSVPPIRGAEARPERGSGPSFAGFDLPDGLDSLLFVLAFSPAS
jgi:hypothetical protein